MGAILTQEQFDREAGFRLSLSIMNRLMEEKPADPKGIQANRRNSGAKILAGMGGFTRYNKG